MSCTGPVVTAWGRFAFLAAALCLAPPASAPLSAQPSEPDVRVSHGGIGDSVLLGLPRLGLTPCTGGLAGLYPCDGVDLLSFVPGEELAAGDQVHSVDDVWGWVDPETGREYLLVALDTGISFVDATNPEVPTVVGYLPSHVAFHPFRDVKVAGDHALVVSMAEGHGLQVFDLSRLRDVTAPPATFEADVRYDGGGLLTARNLAVDPESGFAFATGSNTCGGGLHAVDLQDPAAPEFAGCVDQAGYVVDAQCVTYAGPDGELEGREVCFASAEDSLVILDVTDKAAPEVLARETYPGVGYTHQAWTTPDRLFLLLGDEADEALFGHDTRTYVWDVSRLRMPTLVGTHTGDVYATDHLRYVTGGLVYLTSYTAGLRILDAAGIARASLTEVAYFDVVPGAEVANRLGAIGVYPFLPSGVVAVTATRQGVFLLEVVGR